LIVSNMWGPASYYHNERPATSSYLSLQLLVPISNETVTRVHYGKSKPEFAGRAAVGASVSVTLPNGKVLTRQVDGGNGHSGKRSPDLHFGLGNVQGVVQVQVRWRDPEGRVREEWLNLSPGRHRIMLAWPKSGGAQ
jgi:enediyne biosynthesis protein E4